MRALLGPDEGLVRTFRGPCKDVMRALLGPDEGLVRT